MPTILERLFSNSRTANKLQEALYTTFYSPFTPITPPFNLTSDLLSGYMDNEVIYSIVNKIADTASDIPLELVDAEGQPVEKHWLKDLLYYPNEDTTIKELIFSHYVYLLSIGNAYLYSPKLSDGRTVELWNFPADLVRVISGQFYEPISGYKFIEGNQEIVFEKQNVMHSRLFNPRFLAGSFVYGLSPIQVAAEIIRGLNAGVDRMASMAEQGGPPYIISSQTPEGLTPQQQELLESVYKKKYNNPNNPNNPMLSGTPLKVDMLGSNAADLELIASSEHAMRVLCNVYGVPSVLFNDNANSTYNNVSQARADFYEYTIKPLNRLLEQKLKQFLIPNEDVYLRFNYDNVEVLQESIYTRIKSLVMADFLTVNEKRRAIGYPEMEDPIFDEIDTPDMGEPFFDIQPEQQNGYKAGKVDIDKVS